jgi:glutathione reductase (NADPH)
VKLATGAVYTARHLLIATGAHAFQPEVPGIEHAISSNAMFDLPEQPGRMVIVGGGYIACEFAGIMNGLGTHVTLVYRGQQILRGFDGEVREHVAAAMRARGITIKIERDVAAIEKAGEGLAVQLDNGETLQADQVLYATGRVPNTGDLGLEALGVKLAANGAVVVDDWSQTAVPSIFAVGDVTDRLQLTPVAIREGQAFAQTVFEGKPTKASHALVASAVFTQPEIGGIGMTEEEARETQQVEVYRSSFRPMYNVLAGRSERMLMKLVVGKQSRRVLGCHIVGVGAGEMIQLAAVAIGMGATKEDFDRTVAVHPTAAEELVTMREPVAEPEAPATAGKVAAG